ncbi:winged helix-turn-helix domain-containing protein [Iodobacter fluviatilis]|uniref:OmpR/PhoB-type domain-containing protein n=1 Tax=Iodobacter fluviatilis TaxID=537 RepID=A0A7G3G648_9NEIS|nr:winged helix-turn-helix domain-containing protein [Iodobacter fluviatilis]QBC42619.1 hypothetical protein C1H71_02975 [Iodobacter fluviatilis]
MTEKINFDPFTSSITINGIEKKIGARDALVLAALLKMNGEVASKKFIMDHAWSDVEVTDTSLTKSISTLRSIIQEFHPDTDVIITVPRVGYRIRTSLFMTCSSEQNINVELEPEAIKESSVEGAVSKLKKIMAKVKSINHRYLKIILFILSLFFFWLGGVQIANIVAFKKDAFTSKELNKISLKNGNIVYYIGSKNKILIDLELVKCKCTFFIADSTISVFDHNSKRSASFLFDYSDSTDRIASIINSKMGI